MTADLPGRVRNAVYRFFVQTARAPTVEELSRELQLPASEVEWALGELAAQRALVLRPGSTDVWMAMPFSAVPTGFRVLCGGRAYWANCAWDALGIPAMLQADAVVEADCPDCRAPMTVEVRGGLLASSDGVIHFAVPARDWWKDIGFT